MDGIPESIRCGGAAPSPSTTCTLVVAGVNVLVDPWLVGNLVFADSEWLYKGVKRVFKPSVDAAKQIAANTDVILLTMVRRQPTSSQSRHHA